MRNTTNMAVKEKSESVSEEIEWNVDTEVQLFYAMHGHKPVGVNKYFQMACILEKFSNSINKDISSQVIWDHLDTMYDLQALDDTENLPFPNEEREFSLPPSEFATLMEEKRKSIETGDVHTNENGKKKETIKKESVDKRDSVSKDIKESPIRKDVKDFHKDNKRESKDIKEPKKTINKDVKEVRRDNKDNKEVKKETKREIKEPVKDIRKDPPDPKDQKVMKPRTSVKDKKESKKDDDVEETMSSVKKERVREISESRNEDSPKRIVKRPTRGSIKPDDAGSTKSSSPVTTATPPPLKRRRT